MGKGGFLKTISNHNQRNMTKNPNPINHNLGPKPLSHWAVEHFEKGNPASCLQVVIDGYLPCSHAKDKVESLQNSLQEIVKAGTDLEPNNAQVEPIPVVEECEILLKCFGERHSTEVQGMGVV